MRLIPNLLCWLSIIARLGRGVALPQSTTTTTDVTTGPKPAGPPPTFELLYTAFANILYPISSGEGPDGVRTTWRCTGGNFTGRYLSGTVVNGGGDWGHFDSQTGIFFCDIRYTMITTDGGVIYVQTTGPQIGGPLGFVNTRVQVETGDKRYYWLNNALVIGIAVPTDPNETGFVLRLDIYHYMNDMTNVTFVNGTTYGINSPPVGKD